MVGGWVAGILGLGFISTMARTNLAPIRPPAHAVERVECWNGGMAERRNGGTCALSSAYDDRVLIGASNPMFEPNHVFRYNGFDIISSISISPGSLPLTVYHRAASCGLSCAPHRGRHL